MVFERDIDGIEVKLRIDDYEDPSKHDFGDVWCDCGYSFRFGNAINNYKDHDEILTPEEVDELVIVLSAYFGLKGHASRSFRATLTAK